MVRVAGLYSPPGEKRVGGSGELGRTQTVPVSPCGCASCAHGDCTRAKNAAARMRSRVFLNRALRIRRDYIPAAVIYDDGSHFPLAGFLGCFVDRKSEIK
jgi:hypothetical protein